MQDVFFYPQDFQLKFRYPMCFILYTELEKMCIFLEARSNSKIRLIKGIAIYYGNNGGNNDYCEQRIR